MIIALDRTPFLLRLVIGAQSMTSNIQRRLSHNKFSKKNARIISKLCRDKVSEIVKKRVTYL